MRYNMERAAMQIAIAQMVSKISQGQYKVWNRLKNVQFIDDNDLSDSEIQSYLLKNIRMDNYLHSILSEVGTTSGEILHIFQTTFLRYNDDGDEEECIVYIKAGLEEAPVLEIVSLHYDDYLEEHRRGE